MTITKEKFEEAIESAFKNGEQWGTTYSNWFVPSQEETKQKIQAAKKAAFKIAGIKNS